MILASRSPQRRAILEQVGIAFEVRVPHVEELESGPPGEVAAENAYRKAAAAASGDANELLLGVDTLVCIGSRIYGKPASPAEAGATLRALSGRAHQVISGLCLLRDGRARTAVVRTMVRFRTLDERLLAWYLASEEWRERAGGYAIQGRAGALVAAVEGDYLNVVGLPLATLLELEPELI